MPRAHETSGNVEKADTRRRRLIFRQALEQRKHNGISQSLERQLAEFESKNSERRLLIIFPFPGLCPTPALQLLQADDEESRKSDFHQDTGSRNIFPLPQLIFFQVPREIEKLCSANGFDAVNMLKDSPNKMGSSLSMDAVSSDFLVNTCVLMGNSVKHSRKKKGKKKGKQQKKSSHRKLSSGFEAKHIESTNSSASLDNAECDGSTSSCYNTTSVVLEDTSSHGSSAKENFEEVFDCGICNTGGHKCIIVSAISTPSNAEILNSDAALDLTAEIGSRGATYDGNGTTAGPRFEIPSPSKKNGSNVCSETSCDHGSCCSISSDNCADVFVEPSLDEWSGDVSGNCSDDTDRSSMERNKSPSPLSESAKSEEYKQRADADDIEQSTDADSFCSSWDATPTSSGNSQVESNQSSDLCDDGFHVVSGKRSRRKRKPLLKEKVSEENNYSSVDRIQARHNRECLLLQHSQTCEATDNLHKQSSTLGVHSVSILETSKAQPRLEQVVESAENHDRRGLNYSDSVKGAVYCPLNRRHDFTLNTLSMYMEASKIKKGRARSIPVSKTATQKSADGPNFADETVNPSTDAVVQSPALLPEKHVTQLDSGSSSCEMGIECLLEASKVREDFLDNLNGNKVDEDTAQTNSDVESATTDSLARSSDGELSYSGPAHSRDLDAKSGRSDDVRRHIQTDEPTASLDLIAHSSEAHLNQICMAVNDVNLAECAQQGNKIPTGNPIADIEKFMFSVSPVIGINGCLKSQFCCSKMPNFSLKTVWEWYEEPGCYGVEVKAKDCDNQNWQKGCQPEFCAYFIPYLSAVQLFAGCGNSTEECFLDVKAVTPLMSKPSTSFNKDLLAAFSPDKKFGELVFEYFENDLPSLRCPLYEKIKHLISGARPANSLIFGDPKYLQDATTHGLHPASWFSVAWYPIYRIPQGNLRASFLTYHSIGKCSRRTCLSDSISEPSQFVFPVVGLLNYNDKGEHWFQRRDSSLKSFLSANGEDISSEALEQRIQQLKKSASVMSSAVIPIGNERRVNQHPDYEFFVSRSQ